MYHKGFDCASTISCVESIQERLACCCKCRDCIESIESVDGVNCTARTGLAVEKWGIAIGIGCLNVQEVVQRVARDEHLLNYVLLSILSILHFLHKREGKALNPHPYWSSLCFLQTSKKYKSFFYTFDTISFDDAVRFSQATVAIPWLCGYRAGYCPASRQEPGRSCEILTADFGRKKALPFYGQGARGERITFWRWSRSRASN